MSTAAEILAALDFPTPGPGVRPVLAARRVLTRLANLSRKES